MKFLSWMHRKLMQNNTETMKNSTIGNTSTCLSDKFLFDEHSAEPTKTLFNTCINYQKASNRFEANILEMPCQEESLELIDFLSIGTFGMELPNAAPPTPTLAMPYENMTSQQTEITENDLKLISYELEKFLEAEEKEIANEMSSGNSRASLAGTALSNKQIDSADFEGHVHMADCPLQTYLFANASGLTEADKEMKKEKTSLEELFRRNSVVTNDHVGKCGAKQHPRKGNATSFMKKVVKKFCSSNSSVDPSKKDVAASISIKKKLSKALKMLHKKVHPEEMTEEHITKLQKGYQKKISHKDACQIRGGDEDNMVLQATNTKNDKETMEPSSNSIYKDASTTIGGHWIKTDSDYLVLEL